MPAGSYNVNPAASTTAFGVTFPNPTSSAPYPNGDILAFPLSTIFALSRWSDSTASAPATFLNGVAYTFVLVGDPAAPPLAIQPDDGGAASLNPAYDGRGLHVVAFPNQFKTRSF